MFLVALNKPKQLLHLSYIQHVTPAELQRGYEDAVAMAPDLKPGFRLLADFGQLESMDLACRTDLGRLMELADKSGVGLLVRVIPDPTKDIGLDILTLFHYRNLPRMITCENMSEAAEKLSL